MTHASLDSFPQLLGYEIHEQLYLGSRTAVYRAIQVAQQRSVVIKVLRLVYPSFQELVQFRNQYTIAQQLAIPGIVAPLSLEPMPQSGYALVMEDWGGIALGQYLQQHSLDWMEGFAIALQLTDILHDLHQHRIIHKDIKPANILIRPESKQVKLIDFSIASQLPKEMQAIQSPNLLEGTLAYLAPEQTGRMNRGIDYRADFYALGITLYQLLTGRLPFISEDPLDLIHHHIAKEPEPADQINATVPKMAAAIVTKLMAKNAEDRYQSALGLKYDLEQCLSQWASTGEIVDFELGTRDLSDRFLIPEKLYGRETEVETLLATFDRVAAGSSELMLVAGFSGIGKTAVVNEVHKSIVRQRGYFIKGKYDQFNRNIPLSAFVQALRDLMGQLLSESDPQLQQWKTQILDALGENGQVLIEVIPELEQVIGKQQPAPELSGSAAQNRFNLLFQKFIEVFTTQDHPLVMFLDDLQWADSASLQLIKLLMNDNGYLLMLGAYRDNEVSPTHPFRMTVDELQKTQAVVHTITLAPLTFADTNRLVADTLNCSEPLAQPLTELIVRKTQGNAFFTTQFLKALHEDELITFNCDRRYWECNITEVQARSLTDDVVEFMALQLQKLPHETQQVLKLAACIGNQFDLATLAIVSEQSLIDTAAALWKALQEGLVVPTSQIYKFFQTEAEHSSDHSITSHYRFLHDRVQQAAYSLISEQQQQQTHLHIGQLLLQNISVSEQAAKIFEIVSQLNLGHQLLTHQAERDQLAELNLIASARSKQATAYQSAIQYATLGIQLLDATSCWQNQYALTLALHELATEACYLAGEFQEMETWAIQVLSHVPTVLEKVKVYEVKVQACIAQNQLRQGIQVALEILSALGVDLPENPTPEHFTQYLQEVQISIGDRPPADLLNLSPMSDPHHLAILRILCSMFGAAYNGHPALFPLIIFKQVALSVQFGNASFSTFAYASYGLILVAFLGDVETGYEFGQMAVDLLNQIEATDLKAKTLSVFNVFIRHQKEPLRNTLKPFLEGYAAGLEVGDIEWAAWCAFPYMFYLYLSGTNLVEVANEMKKYGDAILALNQMTSYHQFASYHQSVLNLLGESDVPYEFCGRIYDEARMLPKHQEANDRPAIYHLHINKVILSYLFRDYNQALNAVAICKDYLDGVPGIYIVALLYFYDSLAQLARYSDLNQDQQLQVFQQVEENQAILQRWVASASMNHLHKYELVEAERCRVLGNKAEAIDLYDRAIAGARENGYLQEEALANELAAKFYLNWGKERVAVGYMQEAYYCYARWGAKAKTDDLAVQYPNLLRPILETRQDGVISTLATIAAPSFSIHTSTQTHCSSSSSINTTLDLAVILRASQNLSSTIQLNDLLHQLTQIILQHSGADRCALILPNAEAIWEVQAIATPTETQQCHTPLQSSLDVPTKLIYYVKNTQEAVSIEDCETDLPVIGKYLTQHRPKSVLCLPILNQGHLIGILYLQNRLTRGVFTSDRILILNFLCTQAAISLENARLYSHTQKSQHQLSQLLNNLTGIAYSCTNDKNWTIKFMSGGCVKLTGYPIEDFINNHKISFAQLIDPNDIERVNTVVQEATKNCQPFQMTYRIRTKQGEEKWVWEQGQGLFDQEGLLLGLEGFITDISDRKAAEQAVIQKSQELEQALGELQNTQLQMVQSEKMASYVRDCPRNQ
jgi:PAS domain S-box-containing protein